MYYNSFVKINNEPITNNRVNEKLHFEFLAELGSTL